MDSLQSASVINGNAKAASAARRQCAAPAQARCAAPKQPRAKNLEQFRQGWIHSRALPLLTEAPRRQAPPGANAPRPRRLGAKHRNSRERKNLEQFRQRQIHSIVCLLNGPAGAQLPDNLLDHLAGISSRSRCASSPSLAAFALRALRSLGTSFTARSLGTGSAIKASGTRRTGRTGRSRSACIALCSRIPLRTGATHWTNTTHWSGGAHLALRALKFGPVIPHHLLNNGCRCRLTHRHLIAQTAHIKITCNRRYNCPDNSGHQQLAERRVALFLFTHFASSLFIPLE